MRILSLVALVSSIVLASPVGDTARAQPDSVMPNTALVPSAPVVFRGDTLLVVRSRLGPYSAEDRAHAIVERLTRLSRNRSSRIDQLTVYDGESSSDILSGQSILLTVTDTDAALAGIPRQELVRVIADRTYLALEAESRSTTTRGILLSALFTLLSAAALVITIRLLNRLFRRLDAFLHASRHTRIPSLRIQKLEVLSSDRITSLLLGASKGTRIVCYVVLVYLFLPLILSFFPWTRGLAGSLFQQVLSPLRAIGRAFVGYLPNLFYIAAIVLVTRYLLLVIRWFFDEVGKGTIALPNFYREWSLPTYKIVHFLVLAFAAVVIFPYLPGSGSPGFQGVSVFLGVLFSLGSASSISNMIAGIVLTYMRAFAVGDRVQIADSTGDVIEKSLLVTRIRTIKNVDITVPNALVLGSHIVNFSSSAKERGLILHTTVTIGYDAPWKQVHELLIAAAQATERIVDDPKPFVLQTSLDDFYVSYQLNAFTDEPTAMAVTLSALHQNIQDTFNEAGVEIMSPHYGALRDGNQTTIPPSHLPKGYAAPGFRLFPGVDWLRKGPPGTGTS